MQKKNNKNCSLFSDGRSLNIIAAATASIIADKFTDQELSILALFFSILGDSLATIVTANELLEENGSTITAQEII